MLFLVFQPLCFSLAYFIRNFDGEIVLTPRSSLRCNSHMVSELVGATTSLVRLSCCLGHISSLYECLSLQVVTITS